MLSKQGSVSKEEVLWYLVLIQSKTVYCEVLLVFYRHHIYHNDFSPLACTQSYVKNKLPVK